MSTYDMTQSAATLKVLDLFARELHVEAKQLMVQISRPDVSLLSLATDPGWNRNLLAQAKEASLEAHKISVSENKTLKADNYHWSADEATFRFLARLRVFKTVSPSHWKVGTDNPDRIIFEELIGLAAELANTVDKIQQALRDHITNCEAFLQECKDTNLDRLTGCYVDASTSRRTAAGWVARTTKSGLLIVPDPFSRFMPFDRQGVYPNTASPMQILGDPVPMPSSADLMKFQLDVTRLEVRLGRAETLSRRALIRDLIQRADTVRPLAVAAAKPYAEWLANGGDRIIRRIDVINEQKAVAAKNTLMGMSESYYTGHIQKVWFAQLNACRSDLSAEDTEVLDRILSDTNARVSQALVADRGGELSDAELDVLSRMPEGPTSKEAAFTQEFLKTGPAVLTLSC